MLKSNTMQEPKAHYTETVWMPYSDPRTQYLPLIPNFWPVAIITIIYTLGSYVWRFRLLAAKKAGKLEAKKGGTLQNIIIFYNMAMVLYSSAITLEIINLWLNYGLSFGCMAKRPNFAAVTVLEQRLIRVGYAFYVSKIIELLDTLFFLLRGKVDQVTFLHVFHHAAMPPSLWWGVHYSPGGVLIIFPLINSFIHVIMYTYYGLAAMGAYKYLWWKEYLTLAQMIQFGIMIVHQSQVFWPGNKCLDPKAFPAAVMAYSFIFLALFGNFYIKAYLKKQRVSKAFGEPQQLNGMAKQVPFIETRKTQ